MTFSKMKTTMSLIKEIFQGLQAAPLRVKLLIAGCVIYLLSPIDLIPDFIPVIGQADDVIVFGFLLRLVSKHSTGEGSARIQLLLNKVDEKTGRARGKR